jgi:transposase
MRIYRRLQIQLPRKDEQALQQLLRGGIQQARVLLRALALLQLAGGQTAPQVARNLGRTAKAVREIGRRYAKEGLERALYEKPRPGAAPLLDPSEQQRIIAMVCSDPPQGFARWTVRLVAQEAIKRKLVPKVGRETIRVLLQSHDLQPWREKNVVRGGARRGVHREDGRCSGPV